MQFKNEITPERYHTHISISTIEDGPGDDVHFSFNLLEGWSSFRATFSLEEIAQMIREKHIAREEFLKNEENQS